MAGSSNFESSSLFNLEEAFGSVLNVLCSQFPLPVAPGRCHETQSYQNWVS